MMTLRKKIELCLPALLILLICAALVCRPGFSPEPLCLSRDMFSALWPAAAALLALLLSKGMMRIAHPASGLLYTVYFAAVGMGAAALSYHPLPWRSYEPGLVIWLILSADLALWCIPIDSIHAYECVRSLSRLRKKGKSETLERTMEFSRCQRAMKRCRLGFSLLFNGAAVILLLRHDRVCDILSEFSRWLEYRLSCIDPAQDWTGFALTMTAAGLGIYLMRAVPREHRLRAVGLGSCLSTALRLFMGMLKGFFSVSSMAIPLPGSSLWDIIALALPVLLAPISIRLSEVEENEYRIILRLCTGETVVVSVPQPAASAPCGDETG